MARKIKKSKIKWYEFPQDKEIQFKIKPFTIMYLSKFPSEETEMTPELIWEVFNNSVVDWKGIQDEEGKPLPCNLQTKMSVADQDMELLIFAVNKAVETSTMVNEQLAKNLQKSVSGEDPKVE